MWVIGTAGHVDHGKSTLVKALTGIDPDRLKEEKARQMTIDLGFAWYTDDSGEEIGIVDVPGHRDFIENMLSGISVIDAVLLVIAADEGPMPQTREHLAVIDLLKINEGKIVLTKVDLVQDEDWLELVMQDIREMLLGTSLEGKEIIPVSSLTGLGIETLKRGISEMLLKIPPRVRTESPRLPIDRVFTISGFGTVVTGTLGGAEIKVGDQVEISPPGKIARIRGIQAYHKTVLTAQPGSRAAINLTGIEPREIKRGSVLFLPGKYSLTSRFDTHTEILNEKGIGLQNNDQVKIFVGTAECTARTRLLGKERLAAGETGFVQFESNHGIIITKGDRFILRRLSPAATIGGGLVLDAHPAKRHRLNDFQVLERLERCLNPTHENLLLSLIESKPFIAKNELGKSSGARLDEMEDALENLLSNGKIIAFASANFITSTFWKNLVGKAIKKVEEYHQTTPLLSGISTDNFGRYLDIPKQFHSVFFDMLVEKGSLEIENGKVKLANYRVKYSPGQQSRIDAYEAQVNRDPYNPPSVKVSRELLGNDVYESIIDLGKFLQVSPEVVVRKQEYNQMVDFVIQECTQNGNITVTTFRDHFATNRKVSLAVLEHLDTIGITIRQGDFRVLK